MSGKFTSTNPALNVERIYQNSQVNSSYSYGEDSSNALMTLKGTAYKSLFLIAICFLVAISVMDQTFGVPSYGVLVALMFVGVGLVFAVNKFLKAAPYLAVLYAGVEGYILGVISLLIEAKYPGVALQAVIATIATAGGMFVGFSTGFLKVTEKLKSFIISATLGIGLFYLVSIVLRLFGVNFNLFDGSPLGIGLSVLLCGVAAFNLLLDFDNIANLHGRVEKNYEWVCGVGLLATLVWLYIEILKLLAQLQERD